MRAGDSVLTSSVTRGCCHADQLSTQSLCALTRLPTSQMIHGHVFPAHDRRMVELLVMLVLHVCGKPLTSQLESKIMPTVGNFCLRLVYWSIYKGSQ